MCDWGKKFRLFLNFIRFTSFSCSILGLVSLAVLRYIQAVAYTCNFLLSLLYNIPPISQLMGTPPGALCKSFSSLCSPFLSNQHCLISSSHYLLLEPGQYLPYLSSFLILLPKVGSGLLGAQKSIKSPVQWEGKFYFRCQQGGDRVESVERLTPTLDNQWTRAFIDRGSGSMQKQHSQL